MVGGADVNERSDKDVERGGKILSENTERGRTRERGKNLQLRLEVPKEGIVLPHEDTKDGNDANLKSSSIIDGSNNSKISNSTISFILRNRTLQRLYNYRPRSTTFEWIPANFTFSKLKPVIRSALSAWLSLILFVIPTVENTLGQVCLKSSHLL